MARMKGARMLLDGLSGGSGAMSIVLNLMVVMVSSMICRALGDREGQLVSVIVCV